MVSISWPKNRSNKSSSNSGNSNFNNHHNATTTSATITSHHRRRRPRRFHQEFNNPSIIAVTAVLFCLMIVIAVGGYSWLLMSVVHRNQNGSSLSDSLLRSTTRSDTTMTSDNPSSLPRISVFYHIFIPANKGRNGLKTAQYIIREQLTQVAWAARDYYNQGRKTKDQPSNNNHNDNHHWTIYLSTTGTNGTMNQPRIDPALAVTHDWILRHACHLSYIHCIPWAPHHEATPDRPVFEEVTLQAMHEYCHGHRVDGTAVDEIVIYLHSKGSYHGGHGRNHPWRRAHTQAATHASCLDSLTTTTRQASTQQQQTSQESTCNVCGLQFVPLWTPMFPGNMFSSTCDYVRLLPAPQTVFAEKMAQLVETVNASSSIPDSTTTAGNTKQQQKEQILWQHELYNFSVPGYTGLERYAAEQWIASHPLVRPCDVQQAQPPQDNNNGKNDDHDLQRIPNATTLVLERIPPMPDPNVDAALGYGPGIRGAGIWAKLKYFAWINTVASGAAQKEQRLTLELRHYLEQLSPAWVSLPARPYQGNLEQDDWYRLSAQKLQAYIALVQQQQEQDKKGHHNHNNLGGPPWEYFALPGLLYKHVFFYGQVPPPDSWIYNFWEPAQGHEWRRALWGDEKQQEHKNDGDSHSQRRMQDAVHRAKVLLEGSSSL